jgi:hypothetical protein
MKPDRERATAYHEAGHAVMAFHLGVAPARKGVTIVPDGDASGRYHRGAIRDWKNSEWDSSAAAHRRMENTILICLAGPAAHRIFNPRGFRNYHTRDDYEIAADFALRMQGSVELMNAYFKWLGVKTKAIVKIRWRLIEALAKELLVRKKMSGTELTDFLRSTFIGDVPKVTPLEK